jgi:DNA-directed RNA polymerase subunit delta
MNKKPASNKKRIIKDYEALPEEILNLIKLQYPRGFAENLVYYTDQHGKKVSALPFETEEIYYLVRMTIQEAKQIIQDDDDYDESGTLRNDFGSDNSDADDEVAQAQGMDEVYGGEIQTVELDPEYQEQQTKDAMHKDSEYADVDFDSITLDVEDEKDAEDLTLDNSYEDEYEDYEEDLEFKKDKKSSDKD